jgi:tRNA 2-thiouridine synthesizing protein C
MACYESGINMQKKIIFILSQAPHNGCLLQETLDIILTAAAFDQAVSLLFLDDGVFQIKNHQNPAKSEKKDTLAIFKALEIYDVHNYYVELESLLERNLKPADLYLPVKECYRKEISLLTKHHDLVICG